MKKVLKSLTILVLITAISGCAQNAKEKELQTFIDNHVKKVKPLSKEAGLAYWDAATTGKEEDYDKVSELTLKIRQIYSDSNDFAMLKEMKASSEIKSAILTRQVDLLYNGYLENQIEPELLKQIVELSTDIEKNFSVFRGTINDEKVTDNEIKEILKTETDSEKRHQAWLASKQVGPQVANDLIKLVKLRNEGAQKLGYENYHTLSLTAAEQDVEELDAIFNELYELTNEPFRKLKAELDEILAKECGISVDELMPWHYHDPFFQETPLVYDVDLDTYYKDKDVVELSKNFYNGIGLPVDDILANSDLYEREGKNPHAFSTDIDREGDVRILCNVKNNETWMETMLHELGHANYDKLHDPKLPYLLKQPAHIFTTEAIAMFFGRLSRNPAWMQQMLGLTDEQRDDIQKVGDKYAQLKQLIFARWAMVMYNFEKELYANPDQDLNTLWWQMVEKYQFIKAPAGRNEPDWAAKIHFTIAPAYYHNYMLGELFASQLHNHLVYKVLNLESDENVSYVGQKKVGDFITKNVFKPGAEYRWNVMIERATGEPLTAKYFVEQFVK
ncbi:MAG: M2 family metallopeptidase [Sedimentisphaerales bacterium]|nr:M2 family metallopeptidase [Sedimentisphaerales bacterium]